MALTADRIHDMSREGFTLELPADGADTFYKGSFCYYTGGRVTLTAGNGGFAGICEHQVTITAQDQLVRVRVPKLIVLPDTSAALANRGQRCHAITDDDTIGYVAAGGAQTADSSPIGLVRDVDVGTSVTVEVGVRLGAD